MNSFKTRTLLIVSISFLVIAVTNAQNTPQDYLNTHNTARAQVGVANLVWDTTVANYALTYANSRKADCSLTHSNGPYGENLAKGSSSSFSAISAVNLWVNEKPYYNYTTNKCTGGQQCLHYTQVVWRDSTKLGCARVQCNNGWWFVSCNYNAPGNWVGEYPY
ncbi:Pathogenesis-related leaf protein 4 [Cardamine amara subsp. amara]|uniref:Pathogenesis-related protein 1 n=1 Tax=Cardamine amara subsp. amara TaxID=228776 RepID=A0ABD0ZD43_CARAN